MNPIFAPESLFVSPITPEWTIAELLEWIGADDARCHDEGLRGILDAIDRALHPDEPRAAGGIVTLVRSLAERACVEPGVGERTLGDLLGASGRETAASAEVGDLVPV